MVISQCSYLGAKMTDLGSIRGCRQANSQIKTLHSLQTSFEEEIIEECSDSHKLHSKITHNREIPACTSEKHGKKKQ